MIVNLTPHPLHIYPNDCPDRIEPDPARTYYVVPLVVALAARGRSDLLVPYRDVRTLSGSVIGCRQLAQPA